MAQPAVRVEGARQLRREFREVGDDMSDLKGLHKSLADMVADRAKQKVPMVSGSLQRSIRGSGTKTAARVRSGNNRKSGPSAVPYAGVTHFGWPARDIRPQPFLYDALDDRRREVIDRYEREVRQIVKRVF